GDQVEKGQVLARLGRDALKMAVDEADINLRLAQLDLADITEGPSASELVAARANVQNARAALLAAQYNYSTTLNSSLDSAARARQIEFQWYVDHYWKLKEGGANQQDLEAAWNDWVMAEYRFNQAVQQAKMEELDATNQLDQARNQLYQAQEQLRLLQSGPTTTTVIQAEQKVERARLALEDARADLEAAELRAPFDGTVVAVTALPGQYVGTAPIITLADLSRPFLKFWVEESDMSGVAAGYRVAITFEAFPDETFTGTVVRVEPALVTVGNTRAVQAWASIDLPPGRTLFGGMNAEVEIISAEAPDVLVVPLTALRELGAGQYAVFVVQPDGTLALRPVEVGLKDLVNAEIRSGLAEGEIVSLGEQESTEISVPEGQMRPPEGPVFGPPGGGPMIFR
ncbi:MAG: efflux RND transporter periplasmic adaptor subunit, partial [Anaerolineae bacterium]|nr:efflux RND transporter periplasmic adaptor subunit [Anaerolineae bacterium]